MSEARGMHTNMWLAHWHFEQHERLARAKSWQMEQRTQGRPTYSPRWRDREMREGSRARRWSKDHYWLHWLVSTAADETERSVASPIRNPRTSTYCEWFQKRARSHTHTDREGKPQHLGLIGAGRGHDDVGATGSDDVHWWSANGGGERGASPACSGMHQRRRPWSQRRGGGGTALRSSSCCCRRGSHEALLL